LLSPFRASGACAQDITLCPFGQKSARQGLRAHKVGFCGACRDIEPPRNFGITQLVGIPYPDNAPRWLA